MLGTQQATRSASVKGRGKTTKGKASSDPQKVFSVTSNEFLPRQTLKMYPNKDTGSLTNSPVDGYPEYAHLTGIDFINIHGKTGKAVEELHKVAIGVSENAACLRQLLVALRAEDGALSIWNPVILKRLITLLGKYEWSLKILDMSCSVPRNNEDMHTAIEHWLSLGKDFARDHYEALFASAQRILPYFYIGIYRGRLLGAMAKNPGLCYTNLTKHAAHPATELNAWALEPSSEARMTSFLASCVQERHTGLLGTPGAAVLQTVPRPVPISAFDNDFSDDDFVPPLGVADSTSRSNPIPLQDRDTTPVRRIRRRTTPEPLDRESLCSYCGTLGETRCHESSEYCIDCFSFYSLQ